MTVAIYPPSEVFMSETAHTPVAVSGEVERLSRELEIVKADRDKWQMLAIADADGDWETPILWKHVALSAKAEGRS